MTYLTTEPGPVQAAAAPNAPSTTSFIGQGSGTTFVGPIFSADVDLMAEGYEEFAREDVATAESLLPAAVETLTE